MLYNDTDYTFGKIKNAKVSTLRQLKRVLDWKKPVQFLHWHLRYAWAARRRATTGKKPKNRENPDPLCVQAGVCSHIDVCTGVESIDTSDQQYNEEVLDEVFVEKEFLCDMFDFFRRLKMLPMQAPGYVFQTGVNVEVVDDLSEDEQNPRKRQRDDYDGDTEQEEGNLIINEIIAISSDEQSPPPKSRAFSKRSSGPLPNLKQALIRRKRGKG